MGGDGGGKGQKVRERRVAACTQHCSGFVLLFHQQWESTRKTDEF